MNRLCQYQPQYFPRLHYFARFLNADVFNIIDQVQHVRDHTYPLADGGYMRGKSFQAHTPIKTATGSVLLGISIQRHQSFTAINKTKIAYSAPWVKRHLNTIRGAYAKARNFKALFPEIEKILTTQHISLADLNIVTTFWSLGHLLIDGGLPFKECTLDRIHDLLSKNTNPFRLQKIVIYSTVDDRMHNEREGDGNDQIIEACKRLGANGYYFGGTGADAYMDFPRFEKAGISLKQQDWKCELYSQLHQNVKFIPNLSIIDLLMNTDYETRRGILINHE